MTLQEASLTAKERSSDGYIHHVNASLRRMGSAYVIDEDGYSVCDWMDGTTVESWVSGELV
jgi:hypothetical protein